MITQTEAGTKTAGGNPNCVRLHPQLRKAASTLSASGGDSVFGKLCPFQVTKNFKQIKSCQTRIRDEKMKKVNSIFIIILLIMAGCGRSKQSTEELAFIDVRKNYPEKETCLTDFAEVTYLYLNSDDDDYLYKGRIHCITENTVVVCDDVSGSVLFFSRDGMPKSRFNHKGQGPGEYTFVQRLFYDETTDDVFIIGSMRDRILVFSSSGTHKRTVFFPQGTLFGNDIVSFDDSSFLFYDSQPTLNRALSGYQNISESDWRSCYYRISKVDGAVLDYFELPMPPIVLGINYDTGGEILGNIVPVRYKNYILKNREGALVGNPESDTVFLYRKDEPMLPVIRRIPSLASTDPMIYMNNCVDAGSYQFMEIFTLRMEGVTPGIIPVKHYMRDKKTGEIFRQKIILPDYKGKEFLISPSRTGRDYKSGPYIEFDLIELKEAYHTNQLSGKLKELVATLNEDEDNNVFMLVHFK